VLQQHRLQCCDAVDWAAGRASDLCGGVLAWLSVWSRYQKGNTNLDFTEARESEWQWHQLGHMQVCTSLQTDNHASTPPLSFFHRPSALPATQPTASKHSRNIEQSKEYSSVSQSYSVGGSSNAAFCSLPL